MKTSKKLLTTAVLLLTVLCASAQEGFYKDLFMNGGIFLTSRIDLPAARYLGLSMEAYYSASHNPMQITIKDTIEQNALFVGTIIDENGVLLYPDGAPRFRAIYVNGGRAAGHGKSLTPKGRENIRRFVENGGSYVGTCAGAFIGSAGNESFTVVEGSQGQEGTITRKHEAGRETYIGVYPARTISTKGLTKDHTGMRIEKDSPLLRYYDFGGDLYIDSVYHNGGCWISEDPYTFADGTEILLRYDYDPAKDQDRINRGSFPVTGKISAWAWKKDVATGRVVLCGSHPESVAHGERLDLMAALLRYALDGVGTPVVKGQLVNGEPRRMVKATVDNDPAFTKIGDRQYHHFTVTIPEGARNIQVVLESPYKNIDLYLTLNKDHYAFLKDAQYHDIRLGSDKVMTFDTLGPGTWYVGVQCATSVDILATDFGVIYTGRLEVLNGIPYTLTVNWEE